MVGQQRVGPRSAQGAYAEGPLEGPWIAARVMERGGVAAKTRGRPDSTEARVARGYELLLDFIDELGEFVAKPPASAVFETDCPILGNPRIELSGEPEILNDGEELIGYMAFGDVPAERA